jgi:hypothetical protein
METTLLAATPADGVRPGSAAPDRRLEHLTRRGVTQAHIGIVSARLLSPGPKVGGYTARHEPAPRMKPHLGSYPSCPKAREAGVGG